MISAWTSRDRILASYRVNGDLQIRDLGPAEYVAFTKGFTRHGAVDIREDFPGWQKLIYNDYDSRKLALQNNPSSLFEADVSPVRRFITDHTCKIDAPRRAYIDLETDSRAPFSVAVTQGSKLLSFALVDTEGNKYLRVLEDLAPEAEAELWNEAWTLMGQYDQICAWNGQRFDFEVMKLRCDAYAKQFKMQPYWEHRRRLLFMDQYLCFKRHHMAAESGSDKTSFKLGDVCQALIGEGKNDFDSGKTWDAWVAGGAARQELGAYNLQDTALLPKLEAATGYLELQQTLNEVTLTFSNTHGLKPTPMIDGYMLRKAFLQKTHLPSSREPSGEEQKFEGAFVLPPQATGIHRTVHVCDFKSLYPTVIRTFNISPETKLPDGSTEGAKAFGTNVHFRNDIEGMLAAACREAMELREFWKKEFKKDPNNKSAERKSKAYKIFNNSMYGVTGSIYSRYYDPQIAESVTLGAKALNNMTAEAARARGWTVLYMDTDSLFVSGCAEAEFRSFVKWCNTDLYPAELAKRGVPKTQNCIELDYEKEFDRLIFPIGKDGLPVSKRYCGSYRHYGGKPRTAPEIRGLEYMRGDSVLAARKMQRECIDMLLKGEEDPQVFHEWIKQKRQTFFDRAVPIEEIVLSKGISQALDDYKVNAPHVRVAREMEEAGEDISEGTRISYFILDGTVSPAKVAPASQYTGDCDRFEYWNSAIYPPTLRVLTGAFPQGGNWARWKAKRPKRVAPGQMTLDIV